MNDSELLEAAAKAAGYVPQGMEDGRLYVFGLQDGWNPLDNDGDAFRLAVKLRMHISHYQGGTVTADQWGRERREDCSREGEDYSAATRRAVVRAAAEIGGAA